MSSPIERLLRHDRLIVIVALMVVTMAAGLFTLFGVGLPMSALDMTAMPDDMDKLLIPALWTPTYFIIIFLMWWVMMIAMMIPGAAPTILLFTALDRRGGDGKFIFFKMILFLSGYLAVWGFFSFCATFLQWILEHHALASPVMMKVTGHYLGAGILLLAGLYQFTPLKRACLTHCRAPVRFLTERRRPGRRGAFLMGAEHGLFCLGCCWFLMVLLFFGGIMNLYWIAGLALFILFEKLVPHGHRIGYAGGLVLTIAGGYLLMS